MGRDQKEWKRAEETPRSEQEQEEEVLCGGADLRTVACGRPTTPQMDIPERNADHGRPVLGQRKSVREVVSRRWEGSCVWSGRMMMTVGKERGKVF